MTVIGLTGGISTGKSTVAELLRRELNVPVLDADQVARDIVEPGQPALLELRAAFGPEVLTPEGRLDRKALGARVMADPAARRTLEAITHPRIREEIANRLAALQAAGAAVAVVEAALLVETGSYKLYDQLIVVTCSPQTQLARLMRREGMAEAEAQRWIQSQLPLAQKEALATVVIHNDGDEQALLQATLAAWAQLAY